MWTRIATAVTFSILTLPWLVGGCAAPTADAPAERGPMPDFLLGGIQIHEEEDDDWFAALKAQGMNMIQVTTYAKQGNWDSDELDWQDDEPRLLKEIRGAKKHGIRVILVLRVELDETLERNAFLWHGMIMPKTDELLASWFDTYGRFCEKWAEIAEREGVDVMVIGSELNALASTRPVQSLPNLEEYFLNPKKQEARRKQVLARKKLLEETDLKLQDNETFQTVEEYLDARIANEQSWATQLIGGLEEGEELEPHELQERAVSFMNAQRALLLDHWTSLISDLREVYTGPLGYAANFDQFDRVGFWPELDAMGINAYFPLRTDPLIGVPEAERLDRLYPLLVQGWSNALGNIAHFRKAESLDDQPVIFTETGYTFRRQSTLKPWEHKGFSVVYHQTTQPDGSPGQTEDHVIVWRDQPKDLEERALAIRALNEAHSRLEHPFLKGISYWKLSSHDYHQEIESFMVHIGEESEDPILPELRRFLKSE